jgi:squalene-hopene/tetraprenyl-beta-curcumene cyclase
MVRRSVAFALVVSVVSQFAVSSTGAQEPQAAPDVKAAVQRGLEYLRTKGQAADGTFTIQAGPGITALTVTAAIHNGVALDDPLVAKGLKALEGFIQRDGGIYGNGRLKNYETCVGILAFAAANDDGRYKDVIANANSFVRGLQIGAAADSDQADPRWGGVGYGGPDRPDLSNTSYFIDALKAAGAEGNDEAIQRALAFVSRCQNLDTAFNDTKYAKLVGDGGFYYVIPTEDGEGDSERRTPNGGLRSYGSMSYSGFKSLVYAGLAENDPRVKAVLEWVKNNYSVEENPGVGSAGLFYYYHAFASALAAGKVADVTDANGATHNWREYLAAELFNRQNADGSWTNANRQWFENDPNLATAFALLALANCESPPANP